MRSVLLALVASVLAAPAMAQQLSPMTGTTATPLAPSTMAPPTVGAPPATPPAAGAPPVSRRRRAAMAFQQRFDAANTTHDGKLTLDQAKAGRMPQVVRYFDQIDATHKGYVTVDDIRTYRRVQRQARAAARRAQPPQQ